MAVITTDILIKGLRRDDTVFWFSDLTIIALFEGICSGRHHLRIRVHPSLQRGF